MSQWLADIGGNASFRNLRAVRNVRSDKPRLMIAADGDGLVSARLADPEVCFCDLLAVRELGPISEARSGNVVAFADLLQADVRQPELFSQSPKRCRPAAFKQLSSRNRCGQAVISRRARETNIGGEVIPDRLLLRASTQIEARRRSKLSGTVPRLKSRPNLERRRHNLRKLNLG